MTTTFSPPASCFTSAWATNSVLEDLVYMTVGCPAIDVTSIPASLTDCCGPFSPVGGLLSAISTGCPEGYGASTSYVVTTLGEYNWGEWWCCPTAYGWTGGCALSATNAFQSGGPATVTVTFANELFVTWAHGLTIASSTPQGLPSETQTTWKSSTSGPSANVEAQTHPSSLTKTRIVLVVVCSVLFVCIVCGIGYYLRQRWKRGKAQTVPGPTTMDNPAMPLQEQQIPPRELRGVPVQELQTPIPELPSTSVTYELHGSELR